MTADASPAQQDDQESTGADHPQIEGCSDCHPGIDDLKCKAEGIAAQAQYNATAQPALVDAQSKYLQTRKDYRKKRSDVALEVQDLRHQSKHLVERIKCLIKQERVVDCLDEAWEQVQVDLGQCPVATGCCVDEDCDFDVDAGDLTLQQLAHRIADYQAELDRAKACFESMVAEPGNLAQRVTDAKAELDKVNAALGADPAATDLKLVYASALVARWHVSQVWKGFTEITDFVECLCRALTCWTKASEAISILTGELAIKTCIDKAHHDWCDNLRTQTVDEILCRYDKLCPPHTCEDCKDDHDHDHHDHDHHDHDHEDERAG